MEKNDRQQHRTRRNSQVFMIMVNINNVFILTTTFYRIYKICIINYL